MPMFNYGHHPANWLSSRLIYFVQMMLNNFALCHSLTARLLLPGSLKQNKMFGKESSDLAHCENFLIFACFGCMR